MMAFFEFALSGFWTFCGVVILLLMLGTLLESLVSIIIRAFRRGAP